MHFLLLCDATGDEDEDILVAIESIVCVIWDKDENSTKIVLRDQGAVFVDHPIGQIADLLVKAGHGLTIPEQEQAS